ncbi:flavin-dependent dehydrogenase [Tumidithrix elongata RA019]|uniref:Flavin-dependent dehydrogenase n=1 Tax=Tumidithrix elongata BACA0141 TaxID=2716417 RepID=A0AAW9PUL0_9CYAN|nr:flavin-dependent dehydrogenase [Tumidithrix elongata RA019]
MQQLLYLEIPTPNTEAVRAWLRQAYLPPVGKKTGTADGFTLKFDSKPDNPALQNAPDDLCAFVWTLQRTTYLKVFRWSSPQAPIPQTQIKAEKQVLADLTQQIRSKFPYEYPQLPAIASGESIFQALAEKYPLTVKYFQRIPNGEYDLNRVYWWEKRWRESVKNPLAPKQVVFDKQSSNQNGTQQSLENIALDSTSNLKSTPKYDLIYLGGALGVLHAAMMAKLGYRVCLIERLPFGRMNREWNISRAEFEGLVEFGLFTQAEFESIITCEYVDGFNKFFDGNNPPHLKAQVLHTPTVLNVALDSGKLLRICGEKLLAFGGEIIDQTEFEQVIVEKDSVTIMVKSLAEGEHGSSKAIAGRLVIDAMGSASAIAQQINAGKAFDSVCPTVGAVVEGFDRGVWDYTYGDVLFSHGDISRGRQLIWELFPGVGEEMAIYLFHYHQVHPENPGSLLDMYEDFFAILPEYRRCDMDKLVFKKATFGYIPGHFSLTARSRLSAFDRLLAIGDAAALQSPLVFTGFGSLVRNLPRLTILLDTALKHDLLAADDLEQISAYQSNVAVTWLFSKGMMVPTGVHLPPERVNSMLNTFFGLLAEQPPNVSDRFIKDRLGWLMFNRLAISAALKNPKLVLWIWEMAGSKDMLRWLKSYGSFTQGAIANALFASWLPKTLTKAQSWLEPKYPRLWLRLLSWSYALNYSIGNPIVKGQLK